MTDWHEQFRAAEERMGQPLPPAQSTPASPEVKFPLEVADPVRTDNSWEKEIEDFIKKKGGEFEITLDRGSKLRVCKVPQPNAAPCEMDVDEFRRLARFAALLGAKVVDIKPKAKADEEMRKKIAENKILAIGPCYIEVKDPVPETGDFRGKAYGDFGLVTDPVEPLMYPQIEVAKWVKVFPGAIIEQVPLRIGRKVIGNLSKTQHGAIYMKTAQPREHVLIGINRPWAAAGAYTIDREIYGKYLANPGIVIKITVQEMIGLSVYLTTSDHIRQYGGVIRAWGREQIVMPRAGKYWLRTDTEGQVLG